MNRVSASAAPSVIGVPHVRGDEPSSSSVGSRSISVPHVRGDEPVVSRLLPELLWCSPRAWG